MQILKCVFPFIIVATALLFQGCATPPPKASPQPAAATAPANAAPAPTPAPEKKAPPPAPQRSVQRRMSNDALWDAAIGIEGILKLF